MNSIDERIRNIKDVHEFYDIYLELVGLNKKEISQVKYDEMKKVFLGSVGIILKFIFLTKDDEDYGVKMVLEFYKQINNFFQIEVIKFNAKKN